MSRSTIENQDVIGLVLRSPIAKLLRDWRLFSMLISIFSMENFFEFRMVSH